MNIKQKIGTAVVGLGLVLTLSGIAAPSIDKYRNNVTCTNYGSYTQCGTRINEYGEKVEDGGLLDMPIDISVCYQNVPVELKYEIFQEENVLEQWILGAKPRVDTVTELVLRPHEFVDDKGQHYMRDEKQYTQNNTSAILTGMLGLR